jgi:MFS family permease
VAAANNRIQTITPDRLRGRVMSLYAQALIGVGPLGAVQAGALATLFGKPNGAPWAMAIGATIAGAVVVGIRLLTPEVFSNREPNPGASSAAVRRVK